MLMLSFLSWWYGKGWKDVLESFGPRLSGVANNFSVSQLLKTLFEPWRRIVSYPGASLDAKMRAWGDNMVSRAVGFGVRFCVLFAALLTAMAIIVLTAVELVVWPLLPFMIPGGLIGWFFL